MDVGCKVSCRALFEIRAVSIETDEVIYKTEIVAEGEKEALFDSDLKEVLKSKKLSKYDVDIVVREFGRLPERTPRRKNFFTGKKGKREE